MAAELCVKLFYSFFYFIFYFNNSLGREGTGGLKHVSDVVNI